MSMFGFGQRKQTSEEKIMAIETEMKMMMGMMQRYVFDFPYALLSDNPRAALGFGRAARNQLRC